MKAPPLLALFAIAWVAGAVPARAATERYAGVFALADGRAKAAALLSVTRTGPLEARFELTQTAGGTTIRAYDVDMTKRIHAIVIDEAFGSFQHLHPTLDASGRFTLDVRVPHPGGYYVYADTEPHGIGQQVFRFTVPFGTAIVARPVASQPDRRTRSGPYDVALDGTTLRAGAPSAIGVRITKGGAVARDLRPYLGGAAHAVFVETKTLAYLHVHPTVGGAAPMAMGSGAAMPGMAGMNERIVPEGAPVSGTMQLRVAAPRAGTYALWLQFRGSDGLHVAPFRIVVR